jgi:hypothetical protein
MANPAKMLKELENMDMEKHNFSLLIWQLNGLVTDNIKNKLI